MMWKLEIELPIIHVVLFTSSSSILEEKPEQFHIFKLPGLRLKLQQWSKTYPIQMNENMLDLIKQELLNRHQPHKWQHPFGQVMIRRGALCECDKVMQYRRGKFICPCGIKSSEALRQGLHDIDYLLVNGLRIKNCASFSILTVLM